MIFSIGVVLAGLKKFIANGSKGLASVSQLSSKEFTC